MSSLVTHLVYDGTLSIPHRVVSCLPIAGIVMNVVKSTDTWSPLYISNLKIYGKWAWTLLQDMRKECVQVSKPKTWRLALPEFSSSCIDANYSIKSSSETPMINKQKLSMQPVQKKVEEPPFEYTNAGLFRIYGVISCILTIATVVTAVALKVITGPITSIAKTVAWPLCLLGICFNLIELGNNWKYNNWNLKK